MKEKDLKILCRLRNNGRENLTSMSRAIRVPVSTIHDRIKKYKGDLVKRHTVLLDFEKLGFDLKVAMLMRVPTSQRQEFGKFLKNCENVNNLYRVNNGYDYLAEVLFKDMKSLKEFNDKISELGVEETREFFMMEEIKKEGFLTEEMIYLAS